MGVEQKMALALLLAAVVTRVAGGEFCCADSVTAIEQSKVRQAHRPHAAMRHHAGCHKQRKLAN